MNFAFIADLAVALVNIAFTREFTRFTREFALFTRKFSCFTREFRALLVIIIYGNQLRPPTWKYQLRN
ncbi:hypothetical protein AB1L16_11670 [Peribacillus frigoritolerans]|uniref:hypothetical protein n=1 Tax=Peribacillus frigoritolerans TaxID=450367 RepID=UPI00399FB34D